MNKDDIFKYIQKVVSNPPLILVGSGASASHGLPGMKELGNHLISSLSSKYKDNYSWNKFVENLNSGQDLETALSKLSLDNCIIDDIRKETWKLISVKDIDLFERVVFANEVLPIANLIKKFYQTRPKCVSIITTNYDRIIEYACDSVKLPICTGFTGLYLKDYRDEFPNKDIVNIIKVHGSLDTFKDIHGVSLNIPLMNKLPSGVVPEIITPGLSKFQAVLKGSSRDLLGVSDRMIKKANSFLCIGYGFNDEQIQEKIITKIRQDIPIVVVTMHLSESAAHLIINNAKNFVTIQKGETPNTTEFCINKEITVLDGCFWSVEGFMKIID